VGLVAAALVVACGSSGSSAPEEGVPAPGPSGTNAPPAVNPTPPGTNPPPPQSCARADVAHTAPASLFDAFMAADKNVDKLLADVAAAGGAPLADPKTGRVVFLARGGSDWKVVGSFVGWDGAKGVAMKPVAGTDLFYAETTIPRGTAEQYKLVTGTTFRQDPLAKNLVWDGFDHGTVGEFNAVIHPEDTAKDKGRLLYEGRVHATKLANDRDVYVYLPPNYDGTTCAKLPVIVFHDGNESLTRGDFVGAAEALYQKRPDLSAVLVFAALPTQDVRMAEYSFGETTSRGDGYVDFVVADLLPRIAKTYRVCGKPEARGVSGASLGGLISTYIAFERAGTFGWVGAQSASFFWQGDAMIEEAKISPKIATRFYLDSGEPQGTCGEDDNCAVVDEMAQTLKTKGYDVERVKVPNAEHDWQYWRARLPGMLTHFRDAQTACD
jgi:enterochelin esterase family protein